MVELNLQICELIGSIIGDGNIYDKRPTYVEITGHPINDLSYFENFLMRVVEEELHYTVKIKVRSHGLRIRINNKNFVNFLKELGIPVGKGKFEKVRIPNEILKKSDNYIKSCIRGIFDTDGCVHFDKRKIYKKPYIRIELNMQNKELLLQISSKLTRYEIHNTMQIKRTALFINGKENVGNFLSIIGFRNFRHLQRIKSFYPELLSFNCASIAQLAEQRYRSSAS